MQLEKQFDVKRSPEAAAGVAARDETLMELFPDAKVEIVAREGDRRTVRTFYRALGQDGTATFHFTKRADGGVEFEKVCDGRVWSELRGSVSFRPRGAGTRVRIRAVGRTRSLVPEFTVRGAAQQQIDQMAVALRESIEGEQ